MPDQVETVREVLHEFCSRFVEDPYLCYTEHGWHAFFYTLLYNALPVRERYTTWQGHKMCVVQKEYPTAGALGKPKRQHWDIAVISSPPQSAKAEPSSYDYLRLAAAVEFGMNEPEEHLLDDIERLCHPEANLEHGFIVHLYRLSQAGAKISERDWSSESKQVLALEQVAGLAAGKPVEVFYALGDSTCKHGCGAWVIRDGVVEPVT